MVHEGWQKAVGGHNMFKVVKKLKLLKKLIQKVVMRHGNFHERVVSLCHELDEVQKALDNDHTLSALREERGYMLTGF